MWPYDGFEIDMLSLGDADCIVVTQWTKDVGPIRVLIDGGKASDSKLIRDFLLSRDYNLFYAALCTHLHNDHAAGLIKLLQDPALTFITGWMHDIRNHVSPDALRRASAWNSPQADGVKQVLETTKELGAAFAGRGINPSEPFAGKAIAVFPWLTVLGPTLPFYQSVMAEFTKESPYQAVLRAMFPAAAVPLPAQRFGAPVVAPLPPNFLQSFAPAQASPLPLVPLSGLLGNSSVKDNPTTQPFNNTSAILGTVFNGYRILFTADAGSDALDLVPANWNKLLWMQVPHHGSDGNLSQTNIERFCPQTAYISACGDSSHPSRAVVSGLVKAGALVFSTHQQGHLWFYIGNVPYRSDYSSIEPLRGTGSPEPIFNQFPWIKG